MDRERLEARLARLPLYQYAFIRTDELVFSERVRHICETECPMFGTTWACPPAVGSLGQCRERVLRFDEGLLFSTIAEVDDIADLTAALKTRAAHEEITRQVLALARRQCPGATALSAEACAICERCAYPDAPCRHPERMFPCVESHGILVTDLAERHGLECFGGSGAVTWFSLVLYGGAADTQN